MEKKIDQYKTSSFRIDKVKKKNINFEILNSAIDRTHRLTILVQLFLRAFCLWKFSTNTEIPKFTSDVVKMAYKCIMKNDTAGPKPKGDKFDIFDEFEKFHNEIFALWVYDDKNLNFDYGSYIEMPKIKKQKTVVVEHVTNDTNDSKQIPYTTMADLFNKQLNSIKISGKNLGQIIAYNSVQIVTSIENNIKEHYFDHLRKFVNESFKTEHNKISDVFSGKEKIEKQKELKSELTQVKLDLIENTNLSLEKYRKWIIQTRIDILPPNYDISYVHDIMVHPQKYLKYMIKMNQILEENNLKCFQFFPLRTDIVPKHICIDTKALIELFIDENKNEYLLNLDQHREEIWRKIFDMDHKIFKLNNHKFDYSIMTDGYKMSARFIHNDFIEGQQKKKAAITKGRKETQKLNKTLTQEQIKDNKIAKEQKDIDRKIEIQKQNKQKEEEYKKLSKDEKDKIKEKKEDIKEFKYYDKIKDEEKELLKTAVEKSKIVVIDPGKRSPLYMYGGNDKYFNYTNSMRISETKRLKYQTLRENYKVKNNVNEIEKELSKWNSKTCNIWDFMMYSKIKVEINNKLYAFYSDKYFRKLKWFTYINTKRHEANLMNKIGEVYGEDCTLIIGDWNESGNIKYMSTPGIGMRRKLAERYKLYLIDEFRTSCLHNKTEQKCDNLNIEFEGKSRKIHSVLTYKMESNRMGCINRDRNSVLNMMKIVKYYFETGKRLERYKRGTKINEEIVNPDRNVGVKCDHSRMLRVQLGK